MVLDAATFMSNFNNGVHCTQRAAATNAVNIWPDALSPTDKTDQLSTHRNHQIMPQHIRSPKYSINHQQQFESTIQWSQHNSHHFHTYSRNLFKTDDTDLACTICKQHFNTMLTLNRHLNSRKHANKMENLTKTKRTYNRKMYKANGPRNGRLLLESMSRECFFALLKDVNECFINKENVFNDIESSNLPEDLLETIAMNKGKDGLDKIRKYAGNGCPINLMRSFSFVKQCTTSSYYTPTKLLNDNL